MSPVHPCPDLRPGEERHMSYQKRLKPIVQCRFFTMPRVHSRIIIIINSLLALKVRVPEQGSSYMHIFGLLSTKQIYFLNNLKTRKR